MWIDCTCGCPGERHRSEPPYPCMDCECAAFALPTSEPSPAPPTEREEREGVGSPMDLEGWADWVEGLRGTEPAELFGECARAMRVAADSLRTHSPSDPWPCGCKPWSSDSGDYCPEHRLRLGSIEQRIRATERYLAELRGRTHSPEEPSPETRIADARAMLWAEAYARSPDDPDRAFDIIINEEIRRADTPPLSPSERVWHWCLQTDGWKPYPQLACSYCGSRGPNIHTLTFGDEGPNWTPERSPEEPVVEGYVPNHWRETLDEYPSAIIGFVADLSDHDAEVEKWVRVELRPIGQPIDSGEGER